MRETGACFLLAFLLASPSQATAETSGVEAPSDFQRRVDDPASDPGPEGEADAAAAQVEAIDDGARTAGLDSSGRKRVEEIVVSARKRAELLEDTPVAVTVLGDTALRDSGVTRINQIQDLVPNMTFNPGLTGQAPQIRIRGVGTTTAETAFDPGVGFYVDGVFMARAVGQLLSTIDIQQVEVLRGPQGTLFGKNTVGGAVNVTTVKPKPTLEGFAFVRPGHYGSVVGRAMINVPLYEDRVATRLAVSTTQSRGYVYNSVRDEDLSDLNSTDFIGSVRILPIDDLTVDLSGQYSIAQTKARGGECRFVQPGALAGISNGFEQACREASSPFETREDSAQLNAVTSSGAWGVLEYDAGDVGPIDGMLLKSLTSWRRQTSRSRFDLDQSSYPAIQLSNAGGGSIYDGRGASTQRQIQQELQMNGDAWEDRIHFVTGFFGYWEKATTPTTVRAETDAFVTLTDNLIETDNFTWALYGQATADFTEWASLTAGIRYTSDRKSFDQEAWDPRTPDVPPATGSDEKTFTSWTPMATLALLAPQDWLVDTHVDHLMGYFTYSRGFKGGGFNAILQSQVGSLAPEPFDPETLDNFEIGVKAIGLDQILTVNLAAFYGKYDDIQVAQFITEVDPDGMVISRRVTQNAAEATTKGIEVEVFTQPFDHFIVTGNFGYVDARYDDYPDAENQLDASLINRAGETFDYVPDYQSFLSAQYSLEVGIFDESYLNGWLTPRLEWAYRARFHTVPPEVLQGWQRGYNLLNARLSYDFMDDRAQVAIWAKNLLDVAYFNESFAYVTTFGGISRFYQPPLTFGGEISYRFG